MGYTTSKRGHNVDYLDGMKIFYAILNALMVHKLIYGYMKGEVVIAISSDARDAVVNYLNSQTHLSGGSEYSPSTSVTKIMGFEVREVQLVNDVAWELWFRE